MRLLLDEHLSRHLCRLLKQDYPGCAHIIDFNLQEADDQTIWHFAKTQGFTILSKDSDFHQNTFLWAPPEGDLAAGWKPFDERNRRLALLQSV